MTAQEDKVAQASKWFLEKFEVNGYVDIENSGVINVHGSCRLRPGVSFEKIEHKFGTVTGNFSLRGAKFKSSDEGPDSRLDNRPENVGGVATFPVEEDTRLLGLVQVRCDFMLFDEKLNTMRDEVAEIIKKYCGKEPVKKAILDCQKELIDAGFSRNAML